MALSDMLPKLDDIVVTLVHPETQEVIKNDDGTPMTITMYNKNSSDYQEARFYSTKGVTEESDQMVQTKAYIQVMVNSVKEWNVGDEFTKETATKLFTHMPWILPQLAGAMAKESDFT